MRRLSALCWRVFIMAAQAVWQVAFLACSGYVFAWIKITEIFALDNGTPCWGSRTEWRDSPEHPRTRPPHQYLVLCGNSCGRETPRGDVSSFLLSRGNKNYSFVLQESEKNAGIQRTFIQSRYRYAYIHAQAYELWMMRGS